MSRGFLRCLAPTLVVVALATSAAAQSTGACAPPASREVVKYARSSPPEIRQGGDTIATATPIPRFPFTGSGTTAGYTDDYDTGCPDLGGGEPDVVYAFTPPMYGTLTIDCCGSAYDTKIYVMSAEGQIFDCNDDYYHDFVCGESTSRIDNLWLPPGQTYYLVIDGSGGAAGEYTCEIRRWGADGDLDGDTFATARVVSSLPFSDRGTTVGFIDDYDAACPHALSDSPDVVYRVYVSAGTIDIDLCDSHYDTKLLVYDSSYNLVACNDDFGWDCNGNRGSRLADLAVAGGQYYVVVDGANGEAGEYEILIATYPAGSLDCPSGGWPEGEPPLHSNYVDNWNGGCNTPPQYPFQYVAGDGTGEAALCGVSGWYLSDGSNYRDTDWYLLPMGAAGAITVSVYAEQPSYIFELGPQDCDNVTVLQSDVANPTIPGNLAITGYPYGQTVWFWVGPTVFTTPPGADDEYDYVAWITGLPVITATETTTWSTLKTLYR